MHDRKRTCQATETTVQSENGHRPKGPRGYPSESAKENGKQIFYEGSENVWKIRHL